ncbi:MAG: cellulase family glycosylhydrolase, partial [Huintestinicola sp.]
MKFKSTLKKAAALLVSLSMAVTSTFVTASAAFNTSEFPPDYTYPTQMRGLTAFQIASDMGAGWNLGNSLESENYEEYWGNPKTTKAMIDTIAAKGFTTLRVPVRWDDHYSN